MLTGALHDQPERTQEGSSRSQITEDKLESGVIPKGLGPLVCYAPVHPHSAPPTVAPSPHAGKSTVLRSVASVALLGCCGLLVPAAKAAVPFYDAFMLRNFSGDSPLERLSSFALEVVDMT